MSQDSDNLHGQSWFQRFKIKLLGLSYKTQIFIAIGLIVAIAGAYIIAQVVAPVNFARLSLWPTAKTVSPSESFTVDINLDTAGQDVVAFAAYLTYDDVLLDLNSVMPGPAFGQSAALNFGAGQIEIVRGAESPGVNGSNILAATLIFSVPDTSPSGIANVTFDQTRSAVILDDGFGTDILQTVTNGAYTITGAALAITQGPTNSTVCRVPEATIAWNTNFQSDSAVAYSKESCANCSWDDFKNGVGMTESVFIVADSTLATEHLLNIPGTNPALEKVTTYYYRVHSELTAPEFKEVSSTEQSFFTGCNRVPVEPLEITNLSVDASARSAVVSWNTNKLADSNIETIVPQNGQPMPSYSNSGILTLTHSLKLIGLVPNTALQPSEYCLQARSTTAPPPPQASETAIEPAGLTDFCFTTEAEDLSLDANIVLQVNRDRICSTWLSCGSAVKVENDNNIQTYCFDRLLCDELDPKTGECKNILSPKPGAGNVNDFKLVADNPAMSTIEDAKFLSGYTKAGASWQGFEAEDGQVLGYYPYASIEQVGSSLSIPNGDFETRQEFPWTARFEKDLLHPQVAEISNIQAKRTADLSLDAMALYRVLQVKPTIQSGDVTGVKVPIGRTLMSKRQYYVTFDVRSETLTNSGATPDLIVQFGFHNYVSHKPYATDFIPVSDGWQRVIAGPLEVEDDDLPDPDKGEQSFLGFLVFDDALLEPIQPFYIDNVHIEPVLNAAPGTQISKTCRSYPSEDAPSCRFFDISSGQELQGWEGYCVQTDPRNTRRCIQWLPVDLVAGSSSALTRYTRAGYGSDPDKDRVPLYYCTQARGNAPYIRTIPTKDMKASNILGGPNIPGLEKKFLFLTVSPFKTVGGWDSESGLMEFDNVTLSQFKEWEIEQIRVVVSNASDKDWPQAQSFSLNQANNWEIAVCTGEDCDQNDPLTYSRSSSPYYWQNLVQYHDDDDAGAPQKRGCEGVFGQYPVGPNDAKNPNLFGVKINFNKGNFENIQAGLCDGSGGKGWLQIGLEIYLREWCQELSQVVDPFGTNTAWAGRIADEDYVVPGLGYDYNRDWAPFGGIVAPDPDFDPIQWDSSLDEKGGQPLYVEPANQQRFFQSPYQARASSPYRTSLDCSVTPCFPRLIDTGKCVSGSKLGVECDEHSDCGLGDDGSPGRCTGVVSPTSATSTKAFLRSLRKTFMQVGLDDINIQNLFARSQKVWDWDSQKRQYVLSDEGWDITGDTSIATPARVENIALKARGRTYTNPYEAGDPVVFSRDFGSVTLEFNSIVNPEQLPLVRYTVDWDDGKTSEESNLKIASQSGNPHILTHTYIGPGTYRPRIQIEDNWGWCSGNVNSNKLPITNGNENYSGNGIACDSWTLAPRDIIIGAGENQPPIIQAFQAVPTSGTAPLDVGFSALVSDPDNNYPVNVTLNYGDGTPFDTVTLPNNLVTIVTVTHTYIKSGTFNFIMTATDNATPPLSSPDTKATITVNPPGNTPPTANDDSASTNQDTPVAINVIANDTDPDPGDFIDPATVAVASGPGSGTIAVDSVTGLVTYTPNTGFTGSDSFTYTVDDNRGATSNAATVSITVNALANQPPTVDSFILRTRTNTDPATFDWQVSDDLGLAEVQLWNAPLDNTSCPTGREPTCVWVQLDSQTISGTLVTGSSTNDPAAGVWWYGLHAVDTDGLEGVEADPPGPIQVQKVILPPGWWDPAYLYRQQLTVTNNQGSTLNAPYPAQINNGTGIDTASLVSSVPSKMQADCDDLRIVYDSGASLQEIDRRIINCNTAQTFVWFSIQADIAGSGSDSNYWMYYGNPSAGSPLPADENKVFQPVLDSNTVALYHFEDGSGPVLSDSSGNNLDGALKNGPAWTAGRFGRGLNFDGLDDYVEIAHNFIFGLDNGTIEFWGKPNSLSAKETFLAKDHIGQDQPGHIYIKQTPGLCVPGSRQNCQQDTDCPGSDTCQLSAGLISTRLQELDPAPTTPGSSHFLDGSIPNSNWHHFALTWGSAGFQLFIDGVLQASDPNVNLGINGNTNPILLGASNARWSIASPQIIEFFSGRLDGLRISDIQRTSFPYAQITSDPTVAPSAEEPLALAPVGRRVAGTADVQLNSVYNKSLSKLYQIWKPFIAVSEMLKEIF